MLVTAGLVGDVFEVIGPQGIETLVSVADPGQNAVALPYTPAQPANWPLVPPTNVGTALDLLALPALHGFTNPGVLGPAANVLFTSAATAVLKSGNLMAFGSISVTASAAATITLELLIDGAVVATSFTSTAAAGPANGTVIFAAGVNKAVTHTWGIRATASAGTVTCAINMAKINLFELGG